MTRSRQPIDERFWNLVDRSVIDGCWLWLGARKSQGRYGCFRIGDQNPLAHRVAYELTVGPIPVGLVIDHRCRNGLCVNPSHLEPVTIRENTLRGVGPTAVNAQRAHCIHGHEFTPANTIVHADGKRNCRACRVDVDRRYLQRRKTAS